MADALKDKIERALRAKQDDLGLDSGPNLWPGTAAEVATQVVEEWLAEDRRQAPIDQRVFDATLPCPDCGNKSVIGYLYLDQHGHHQHTQYVCTFWRTPEDKSVYLQAGYDASKDRCGWQGWSVPGWDEEAPNG